MGKRCVERSRIVLFCMILLPFVGFQCSLPFAKPKSDELSIVAYNVHNLFDCHDDGDEYPEFKSGSKTWDEERYHTRLKNTALAVRSFNSPQTGYSTQTGPDILCLEEIENKQVLDDLADGEFKSLGYKWRIIGGPENSSIKCGILSRLPVKSVVAHNVADAWGFGEGRDILEVVFDLSSFVSRQGSSQGLEDELTVFLCHWKSKKEGEQTTEVARIEAARLVASRIRALEAKDKHCAILVCGDFNESPDEFQRVKQAYQTAIMPVGDEDSGFESLHITYSPDKVLPTTESSWALFSPWGGSEEFSYAFEGKTERLDGFLLNAALVDGKGLDYEAFEPAGAQELFDNKGNILCWDGKKGFSDHLPIELRLRWRGGQ